MSMELKAGTDSPGGRPAQDPKREVDHLLTDMAIGLDLSRKLMLIADGPWEEFGHSGRLQLPEILRDCAHKIMTESMRCRMELEAKGMVHFGAVVLEESTDGDELLPGDPPPKEDSPYMAFPSQDSPKRRALKSSPPIRSSKIEPSPLRVLRHLCAAFLESSAPGKPRVQAGEPK